MCGVIYYALHKESNILKIGCSRNPRVRVSKFCGFVLIATETGGHGREAEVIDTFAVYRSHAREWFRYEGALRSYVENLRSFRAVWLPIVRDERQPGVHVFGWIDMDKARLIYCGAIPARRTMRKNEPPIYCYNCRAVIAVPWAA